MSEYHYIYYLHNNKCKCRSCSHIIKCVKQNGLNIKFVRTQLPEICLMAVKNNPNAIQYIIEPTVEICIAAIEQDVCLLQIAIDKIPENDHVKLYIAAIVQDPSMCLKIPDKLPIGRDTFEVIRELCLLAVKQDGFAIQYMKERFLTEEIYIAAIHQNSDVFCWINKQTIAICLAAVKLDGTLLRMVRRYLRTPEVCLAAVREDERVYEYMSDRDDNKVAVLEITEICIAFKPLRLPSYVLLEIIDWSIGQNTLKHIIKINQIIRINEKKLNLSNK
jgi:hypothetical protein